MSLRTKKIAIRLTPEEHEMFIQKSKGYGNISEWIRYIAIGEESGSRKKAPDVNPQLLRQLQGIGNNINQIARVVNQEKSSIDKIELLTMLHGAIRLLEEIKNDNKIS